MKYLHFKNEVLVLVSKTKINEDSLEVSDDYNFKKEIKIIFKNEEKSILVDKSKKEVLNELFPKVSIKEIKNQQRISAIKRKAGEIINSRYSIIKQLNITNLLDGYTDRDKENMIDFINSIRAISNKAELEGTELEDIDWGVL